MSETSVHEAPEQRARLFGHRFSHPSAAAGASTPRWLGVQVPDDRYSVCSDFSSELLRQTLDEEKATDARLTQLAERKTNQQAEEPAAAGTQEQRAEGPSRTEREAEEHPSKEAEAHQVERHEVMV